MGEFIRFRRFITPVIIQIIFWIGVALVFIGGIAMMVLSEGEAGGVIAGLLTILLGPIFVRIYCELLILGFRLYDTMVEIKNHQAYQSQIQGYLYQIEQYKYQQQSMK